MDIGFNRHLSYDELDDFLVSQVDCSYFIVYGEEQNDWNNIDSEQLIVHYIQDDYSNRKSSEDIDKLDVKSPNNFYFGMSVYPMKPEAEYMPIVENLAFKLSNYFSCSSFCDASRILLAETLHYPYYSLLYEEGKVYLVDDYNIEESGYLTKIIELSYSLPPFKW